MSIFFIVVGIASLAYGALKVIGIIPEDISKDSASDKKALSEKGRYFIGRYYAGNLSIIAGISFILVGLALYFR